MSLIGKRIHSGIALLTSISTLCLGQLVRVDIQSAEKEARLHTPFSIDFDGDGIIYGVECTKAGRVFKMDPRIGSVTFIAGESEADAARKNGSTFKGMHDLAVARNGDIYLADTHHHRICKIDGKTGTLSTIAGTGEQGFSGDGGPATEACLGAIFSCALNQAETILYLADLPNKRIRAVELRSNCITTIAGNGGNGTPIDGAKAINSPLPSPRAVTIDDQNNIYIVSRAGHALRVVKPDGTIHTQVNAKGTKGYRGDGGNALNATLNGPKHACVDPLGNVIIVDAENQIIRKYVPSDGTIHLVAGTPETKGKKLHEDSRKSQLNRPHGVRTDTDGNLYIADSFNNRILVLKHQ